MAPAWSSGRGKPATTARAAVQRSFRGGSGGKPRRAEISRRQISSSKPALCASMTSAAPTIASMASVPTSGSPPAAAAKRTSGVRRSSGSQATGSSPRGLSARQSTSVLGSAA